MSVALVYITASGVAEAEKIGRELVVRKLAACVNILPHMTSIYEWEGELVTGREAVLLAKTRAGLVNELTLAVKSLHSYDCPCVLALDAVNGNREFFDWIRSSTRGEHDMEKQLSLFNEIK